MKKNLVQTPMISADDLEYYVKVLEQLENYDKSNVLLKVEKILLGLGFNTAQFTAQVNPV